MPFGTFPPPDQNPYLNRVNQGSGVTGAAATAEVESVMRPFADVFPAANVHHHFVGQDQAKGVYAKELHIPAGFRLVSHSHEYDHLSIIASGVAILTVDGSREHSRSTKKLVGPCAVTIKAGKYHTLNAMTDLVWFCIHPTDETDAAKVDDAILKPD